MKIEQVHRTLTSIGLSVQYEKDCLKEVSLFNGNSYHLMKRGSKWVYEEIDYESNRGLEILEFSTEGEGIKYFLLDRLQSYYLHKYKSICSVGETITSFADFEEKMKKLGVGEDNYSFSAQKPRSFLCVMEDSVLRIRYINKHNKIRFSSSPLAFDNGSKLLFTYVYLLYLLKNLESLLMNEQILVQPFVDEYIETFIK